MRPLIVLLFLGPLCALGQPVRFIRMTEREGLSHHDVAALHRDRHGVLWIGTREGLDRYDGATIEHLDQREGLPSPSVRHIAEDSAGLLWLGTAKGLARLDPLTRKVTAWPLGVVRDPAEGAYVNAVLPMANGDIVCITVSGVQVFRPSTGAWTLLRTPQGEVPLPIGQVLSPDSGGTGCWIATVGHGSIYYQALRGEVYGRFHVPADEHPLLGMDVSAMCSDHQGGHWLFDHVQLELVHHRAADGHLERWKHLPGHPELPFTASMMTLYFDRGGHLWASGYDGRPFVFDTADSTVTRLPYDTYDPGTLAYSSFTMPYEEPDGTLWIPTPGGISIHDPQGIAYRVSAPSQHIRDIPEAYINDALCMGDSVLWLATEYGLIRHTLRDDRYDRVVPAPGDPSGSAVLGLLDGDDGRLWLATREGIRLFDPRTGRSEPFRHYPKEGRGHEHMTYAWLLKDRTGGIWAGTWGAGLYRYDPATEQSVWFAPGGPSGLPAGDLYCGLETSDGSLWLGHAIEGLVRFDPATQRFERFKDDVDQGRLPSGRILTLAEDASGHLWIGADGAGLVRYDRADGSYRTYGRAQGLRNLSVGAIRPDRQGRLWLGSQVGLACFDPATERISYFPTDHGQSFSDLVGASFRMPDGSLFFTDLVSALWFDPQRVALPAPPAAPRLQEVRVHGERIDRRDDEPIVLRHSQDRISLHFATFAAPGRVIGHAYRLASSDTTWVTTSTGNAVFDKLRPGTYTLLMRAQGSDGVWGAESSVVFTVVPPWWQLTWVRVIGALLLAGAIVLLFRLRLELVRKREREEERLARTMNDLRLRALRAQMDPHFIFNCLNAIDKYILMEQGEKASHYLNSFARLVRLILNQSDSVRVPLEKEAELLRYYIELECLRFRKPFAWEVRVDPELLLADVELPTMLVQPYVENAIRHGLQHKADAGRLLVEFRKRGEEVECTIEDDGIGRAASAVINAERGHIHHSKSMQVNADRMKLFEEMHSSGVLAEVIDLKDREGNAIGTRVRLVLPIDDLDDEAGGERSAG